MHATGARIHLDMTPLVDVAFLLLTFFMFASTMNEPSIMEVTAAPDDVPVSVSESNLLTLALRADGALFYSDGVAPDRFTPLPLERLRAFAVERNTRRGDALLTVLRVHPDALHQSLIATLDQLGMAESDLVSRARARDDRRERRFAIMPLDEATSAAIAGRPNRGAR